MASPKPRGAPCDPNIKVSIEMPASLAQRLRDHARDTKSSVSRLCRDGALAELLRAAAETAP